MGNIWSLKPECFEKMVWTFIHLKPYIKGFYCTMYNKEKPWKILQLSICVAIKHSAKSKKARFIEFANDINVPSGSLWLNGGSSIKFNSYKHIVIM